MSLRQASAMLLCPFLMAAPLYAQNPANAQSVAMTSVAITVDTHAATTPFPHFWEHVFGSGRAVLSLRESYRNDLRTVKAVTEFNEVRFHGIFMDEVGLYDPDRQTINFAQTAGVKADPSNPDPANPDQTGTYNFSYIDQIYDGLLANGIRPFVELSFMPRKMASDPAALHAFWYKPNVSPPKDYKLWDGMITAFAHHLIARYGIAEVSKWTFEVWNEPNIDFWVGNPKQPTYFELYDHTALALKKVNQAIRIGGPSTAQAAWVAAFLKHCKDKNIPVDFASTHVYANDTAKDVMGTETLGTDEQIPRDTMVCRSVMKVHKEIVASPYPKIPLIFSEYNASYANEPNVTDSIYMGPWLATTISQCDGLTESMSYWSFSDVFEEQGVVRTPFYGGFGLVAADGIPKPSLNAFSMLHRLGTKRLKLDAASALATLQADGSLAIALWNYAAPIGTGANYTAPTGEAGPAKNFTVKIVGVRPDASVTIQRLDADHGNVIKAFDAMNRPPTPSLEQIKALKAAGKPSPTETTNLHSGVLSISIPAQGLVLITIGKD